MQMNEKLGALRREDVERRFERAAPYFEKADFVHRHTAAGLLERLSPMQINAMQIVDLGSGLGRDRKMLQRQFRDALVIGVDRSASMLALARRNRPWLAKTRDVRADAERLPFASGSIDLVYANLLLPWIDDHAAVFIEIARVLRKDGLFLFATLGQDSFRELRTAWAGIDSAPHVREFPDMHDIGDALVKSGLRDPVLDVDTLALQFRDSASLFRDIRHAAAGNSLRARRHSLAGRSVFRRLATELAGGGDSPEFTITLELVFGHAWGGGPRLPEGEYRLPAAAIGRRRRT
jgi:malonyl-CoA O-methyltransferase